MLFFIIVLCSMLLLLFQVRRRRQAGVAEDEDVELAAAVRTLGAARPVGGCLRRVDARHGREEEVGEKTAAHACHPACANCLFGVGVAALFFFFLAPIAWIAIASVQTEEALKQMPPQLSLDLWLDGYVRLIQAKNWQGSLFVSLSTAI